MASLLLYSCVGRKKPAGNPRNNGGGCKKKLKDKMEDNMKHEKKLTLEELKIQSFSTELNPDDQKAIKGGSVIESGRTSVPTFC